MPSAPKLIYFDMGNVLLHFDHDRACRQMAELSGVPEKTVWDLVFGDSASLQWKYERGEITSGEFHEAYCEALQVCPDWEQLLVAASDIFTLNVAIVPIIRQLCSYGHRLGILSNTCPAHWEFITQQRFRILPGYFEVIALSYQLQAMKPAPESYQAAAKLAKLDPAEIFYVDDRMDNVQGANEAGFRAYQYTTPAQLAADLRANGVRLVV